MLTNSTAGVDKSGNCTAEYSVALSMDTRIRQSLCHSYASLPGHITLAEVLNLFKPRDLPVQAVYPPHPDSHITGAVWHTDTSLVFGN